MSTSSLAVRLRRAERLVAEAGFVFMAFAACPAIAGPVGFASLNGGTTGGAGGPTVTATTGAEFKSYAEQEGPLVIRVEGALDIGDVRVKSNKTISGIGATGAVTGSLRLSGVSNVIVRNLSISNPGDFGEGDAVTIKESNNVWFDHNNIFDAPDGLLDIARASDYVTVSWNKFYYTQPYAQSVNTNHRFAMLIGNSDSATEDIGRLNVTLHNNHWGEFVRERMPRVRYGDVHVFNNYFNSPGNNYAVRSAVGAELLIENNHFENIDDAWEKYQNSAGVGRIEAVGNLLENSDADDPGSDNVFDPPYSYDALAAEVVRSAVLAGAGIAELPGDYNADGLVDAADYTVWRDRFGAADGALPNDADGGPIGAAQRATWAAAYGETLQARSASQAVPEPASAALLLCAAAALLRRSRTAR
ncbi:polysaccharide lyase family 1 protein [Botrimarina sp.]|uniref:pectate lyase family protein n=1 Tax=Botrimarina sp. TaxID=2795802 RepID=UPI0032EDF4AA